MYTLETLIPDCVGRYITSSSSGSVQLAALINGRTYAKVWQALVYWIVAQYELGHSTNLAPLGVIVRGNAAETGGAAKGRGAAAAAAAAAAASGAPGAPKAASFRFFQSFLDKHGLSVRPGAPAPVREDDLSTIRMNLATLARLADVEPGTFRIALSHLFRRLGEVLQAKEQVLIDFSVGSLVGDKATLEFLFHQEQQAQASGAAGAGEKAGAASSVADPRLLHKGGRWRGQGPAAGARALLADSRALRQRYPLEQPSSAGAGASGPRVQRLQDEAGNDVFLDETGTQLEPSRGAQLWLQQQQAALESGAEEKEQGQGQGLAGFPTSTNDIALGRLAAAATSHAGGHAASAAPVDALPNSGTAGFTRKLQGKQPLRNVRKLLAGATLPENAALLAPAAPLALVHAPAPPAAERQGALKGRSTRFALDSASPERKAKNLTLLGSAADEEDLHQHALLASASSGDDASAGLVANLPPVLDSFARTQAATYSFSEGAGSSASSQSTSGKIASFYTPEAAAFAIVSGKIVHSPENVPFVLDRLERTEEEKTRRAREMIRRIKAAAQAKGAGGSMSTALIVSSAAAPSCALSAPFDERAWSKSLLRYQLYVDSALSPLPDGAIAPIKEEWVRNGLALLNTSIGLLSAPEVERIVKDSLADIKRDYLRSMKKSILDYVLRNHAERARLSIPITPPSVDDWGSGPAPSRPPLAWRAPIQRAYRSLSKHLFRNNPAMLSLLDIWSKYEGLLLVDLPSPEEMPLSMRAFEARQKAHRDKVQLVLVNEWGDEVEYIFSRYAKEENLTDENSAHFFEAVATVCATQLRSIVENSARALHEFFMAYKESPMIQFGPAPLTEEEKAAQAALANAGMHTGTADATQASSSSQQPNHVKSLTSIVSPLWIREEGVANNPRPVFLQKLLVHKLKDGSLRIEYELPLAELEKSVSRLFDDTVSALNDFPRVENKLFSTLEETKYLQLQLDGDSGDTIWGWKRAIATLFNRSASNAHLLLSLYDEYAYLLDEEKKVHAYLKLAHALPEYREQVMRYRATAAQLQAHTSRLVRTPMILCDCSAVNELLAARASDMSAAILTFLAQRNIDKNIHLCEKFKSVSAALLRKPANTRELVDLVKYLAKFKKDEREDLVRECAAIKEQLRFLYDNSHPVGTDILSHVGASWAWLLRMDNIIRESDALVSAERSKQEHACSEARDLYQKQLTTYAATAKQFEHFGDIKKMQDYETALHELKRLLAKAEEDIETLHVQEGLLGLTQTDFYLLQQTKSVLAPYETLWSLVANWEKKKYAWLKGPVFKLDATQVEQEVDEMFRTAFKLAQQLSETAPVVARVAEEMKKAIQAFKPHIPLLHVLCNAGMRDRHWAIVSDIIQFELRPDAHTPLNRVLEMSVEQHLDALSEVSEAASKEHAIEKAVAQMKGEWSGVELAVKSWKDSGTYVLQGDSVEEVQTLLDDHLVKTQTMKGSPFAKPFADAIREWEAWLTHTAEIVEVWTKVQTAYVYLAPVFGSDDITKQMPAEGTMFKVVDANWHKLMADVVADTKLYQVSVIPHLLGILKEAQSLLDTIQTGLNQYLETKRLFFPRFYFLSNDELLEILSETKDPLRVQPHLKKCFEGVSELEFRENLDIVAMQSKEGESVPLVRVINPSDAKGAVERWLKEFEHVMRDTVLDQCAKSLKAYTQVARAEWTADWPGQVVLTVAQIHWTQGVARAIHKGKGGLAEFLTQSNAELQFIVHKVRGDLSYLQRCTLGALVVIDVHARDVVEHLIAHSVSDVHNFEWQAQLRYYWNDAEIQVRMINAQQTYGNEYLGNSDRLVITALTDRCYRTLLGALSLNLGGAPEGPAGTGKTETTKDLAKACAIQCVVFNCSDGLDYMAMGKFFKGLASSGAWACFDEFNRIDLEVLSVVAQQIQTIQRAKELRVESFVFEGTEIQLKRQAAVFITMNPGYAGRSELPDNLKSQFRTVAMMIPDYGLIAQILLYSYGFVEAQSLSRKIVATYKLCSEQLSSQDHYDYGMRAVKATLSAAQQLKQRFPKEKEGVLLLRSVTDVNLPKFLSHDIELFQGILSDLFPGVKPQTVDYGALLTAIQDNCARLNLQPVPSFITKILQLYETITVRHGLMLVGLPQSGKSMCARVLAAALGDLAKKGEMNERKVVTAVINPKSITSGQLYGNFDPVSHEWTDGILARRFNEFASATDTDRKWLIFDGPVDAIWIENMNTVLDDNKKLCLMSGQIIHMSSSMNMIFEVRDLAVASPATVSRCGMVYLEPQNLGWRALMQSWLNTLPGGFDDKAKKRVETLFDWLVPPCLRVVHAECVQYVPSSDSAMVNNLMQIMDALLIDSGDAFADLKKVEEQGVVKSVTAIESMFLFALVWSIGASVDGEGRKKFDRFLREVCKEVNFYKLAAQFPKKGLVHDYVFSREGGRWMHWSETLSSAFRIPAESTFQEIIVPTVDSARYKFILEQMMRAKKPTLYIGPTGTGKSVSILDMMSNLSKDTFEQLVINFSAQTTAGQTQALIDDKLDRRRRGVFGPSGGKQMVVFVDDLNMPLREKYFAQPPIELLRQYLDQGGWYNIAEFQFHTLVDMHLVSAMGPPGGGRNPVTDRLLRHFVSVSLTPFDDATVSLIFTTILRWHFDRFPKFHANVQALTEKLVQGTRELYGIVTTKLLPTPAKTHYTYNLRDIARVFQGLCLSTPDSYPDPQGFLKLWIHEVHRVFCDRLVNDEDSQIFLDGVKSILKTRFATDFSKLMSGTAEAAAEADQVGGGLPGADGAARPASAAVVAGEAAAVGGISPDMEQVRSLFFGSYMSRARGGAQREYAEISDIKALHNAWVNFLEDYNAVTNKPMSLVLFRFAIEHASRIARILQQPGGHALLVGVGGSGKQSLTRLAASMLEYDVMSIELSKSFGSDEWGAFLRKLLRKAGADAKHVVFLANDMHLSGPGGQSRLEAINSLLNAAQVSNLWPADELAEALEVTRLEAKKLKRNIDGQQALLNYFIAQCKSNLHVVLCMSPIGNTFRERLRMFPSLINCMTMSYFQAWPADALTSVASDFLSSIELDGSTRSACVTLCQFFQKDVEAMSVRFFEEQRRQVYVTPTSYLELIQTFQSLLALKRKETTKARSRYQNGLDKLAQTEKSVREMQVELEQMQPALLRTSQETDAMMQVVTAETAEAQKIRESVAKEEAQATEAANMAKAIERECAADLSEAMPILEAAIAALDTLTTQEISEIKAMRNPPRGVRIVMEVLCVMKNIGPARVPDPSGNGKTIIDYWGPSVKYILSDPRLLQSLVQYNKDDIPPKVIKKVREYIAMPDFQLDKIKAVSRAAFSIASWIYAIEAYDRVVKQVQPKREALLKARGEYDVVKQSLDAARGELAKVESKIGALNDNLRRMQDEKAELEAKMQQCSIKLERAHTLLSRLGGEKTRWTALAAELGVVYTNLTGDILLSAAVIAYLGPFTASYRAEALERWAARCAEMAVPCSSNFTLTKSLGDPVLIRQWGIHGLPVDSFSIDNAIISKHARRYSLAIDPQGQANRWIKNSEKDNKLVVVKASDDYTRALENAIQFGNPVLLENVGEELDPALDGVLLRQVYKKGAVRVIKYGDAEVEFSDSFRLFLTTKLSNPFYLPEVQTKVELLMFAITPDGLTDQLLSLVVAAEKPELESERSRLIVTSANNSARLKEIEDKILQTLATSAGNILDDSSAVEILSASKAVANEIEEKQAVAAKTEKEIDASRQGYRPVASHASVLYFTIADLAAIDPMYQYSLGWFTKLFAAGIDAAEFSHALPTRIQNLNDYFSYSLYTNVCRSLFSKDRTVFSLLLTARLLLAAGRIEASEWRFLLTGGSGVDRQLPPNPAGAWLSDKSWAELCRLSNSNDKLRGLHNDFGALAAEWKGVYDSAEPHLHPFPGKLASASSFHRLLLLRCLRPDKVIPAARDWVVEHLGARFTEVPPFDLSGVFAESATDSPIVFVLSAGSDPMAALMKFAADRGVADRVSSISLGQGQGPIAARMIDKAVREGGWVVLQNAHLAPSWLPALERLCDGPSMKPASAHPDFRLWITSYPSPQFPASILQSSVKLTTEAPAGLRQNMLDSYLKEPVASDTFFASCRRPAALKALTFSLAFFHALVQERRHFASLGWNIPYGWNDSDFSISVRQLHMFLDESAAAAGVGGAGAAGAAGGLTLSGELDAASIATIPFRALSYIIGEVNYGGRVTDDWDRRTLLSLLSHFITPGALQPNYALSASGQFIIPPEGPPSAYLDAIRSFPLTPLPEVFGLHDNADITKDAAQTGSLFASLLQTDSAGGVGGSSREVERSRVLSELAADVLRKLPPRFDVESIAAKFPVQYNESMNSVLVQECIRYNRLTDVLRSSLSSLLKALSGEVVMSREVELLAQSLFDGTLPDMWAAVSYPSLKPLGSYVTELQQRLQVLTDWIAADVPAVVSLPALYFPQSFLTAVLQNHARRNKIAIDDVQFDFAFLDPHALGDKPQRPDCGAYVKGMFLEGARWDFTNARLAESNPKVLFTPAPILHLKPGRAEEQRHADQQQAYVCPMYRTQARRGVLSTTGHSTNFIMSVRLPTNEPPAHWVNRGVALICSLSD